jgi:membrane-associated phospholipid phosphatase
MKKYILMLSLLTSFTCQTIAQTQSPYKTSTKVDLPVTLGGMAFSGYGLYLIVNKHGISDAHALQLDKADVNGLDRFSAGNYDEDAKKLSDKFFYPSFAAPFLLLFNDRIAQKAGQVGALYVETMAVTGALFAMTAGNVYRLRPLAYGGEEVPISQKTSKNARNSFYAGHTAATASATFFLAKVFHDFNPDSPARPYVWTAAAAIPATVGYLRLKAGKHFLSDNLLGYALGAGAGILVPQLHKKASALGIHITPISNPIAGNGLALTYNFK